MCLTGDSADHLLWQANFFEDKESQSYPQVFFGSQINWISKWTYKTKIVSVQESLRGAIWTSPDCLLNLIKLKTFSLNSLDPCHFPCWSWWRIMISNAQLSHDNVLDEEIRNHNTFVDVRPHDGHDQRLPPSLRKLLNPVSPLSITTSKPLLPSISPGHPSPPHPKSDLRYLDHFQVINNVHDCELDKESDSTPDSSDKGENDFDIRFTSSSNLTSPPWSHTARSSKG